MPSVTFQPVSGNAAIDGLFMRDVQEGNQAAKWDSLTLTYSFPTSGEQYLTHPEYLVGGAVLTLLGPLAGLISESATQLEFQSALLFGWQSFNAAQQNAVDRIAANVNAVSNLNMVRQTESTTSHATIRYGESPLMGVAGNAGIGIPPGLLDGPMAGDIWIDTAARFDTPVRGNEANWLLMHETLHGLGLKHAHEEGLLGNGAGTDILGFILDWQNADDWGSAVPGSWDSPEFTVMTYRDFAGGSPNVSTTAADSYPQSLMMLDIAALQHLYGADFTTNGSNTDYRWNLVTGERYTNGTSNGLPAGDVIFETIWDGGGIDTFWLDNYTTDLSISLEPGGWSTFDAAQLATLGPGVNARANVFNAMLYRGDTRSLIENAVGGLGSDSITGNVADNRLTGNAGNDTLIGLGGFDTLTGGAGRDSLYGGELADTFDFHQGDVVAGEIIDGGTGTDKLRTDHVVDFSGASFSSIEQLAFVDAGAVNRTTFAAGQIGAGLASSLAITGSTRIDQLAFTMGTSTVALLGNLTFSDWSRNDTVTITGDTDAEVIFGTKQSDTIYGGDGTDSLSGDLGVDRLYGGGNDDTIIARDIVAGEVFDGGLGIDSLFVTGDANFVPLEITRTPNGGFFPLRQPTQIVGIERLDFGSGAATNTATFDGSHFSAGALSRGLALTGSASADNLVVQVGFADSLSLSALTFTSWAANDTITITGDASSETITATRLQDRIIAGLGDDTLIGGAGGDLLDGGGGVDTASYANAAAGVTALMLQTQFNTSDAAGDSYVDVENLTGSAFDDVLRTTHGSNVLRGGNGNDHLDGLGGALDIIDGGLGIDTAGYFAALGAVSVDLAILGQQNTGGDGIDQLISIENLYGSTFGDLLKGDDGRNVIRADGGDDEVHGRGDSDTIYGWTGNDKLFGGAGIDTLHGEQDNDILAGGDDGDFLYGGAGVDNLYGGDGADILEGGAEGDILLGDGDGDSIVGGAGDDYLYGGEGIDSLWAFDETLGLDGTGIMYGDGGNDILHGSAGADYFYGGAGADTFHGNGGVNAFIALGENIGEIVGDTIYGGAEQDYVYASDANDTMYGGAGVDVFQAFGGDDVIEGGADVDYLYGGTGNDQFIVRLGGSSDLIYDFTAGGSEDAIHLVGTGLTSFAEVQGAMSYSAGLNTTILTLSDVSNVWIIGVAPTQLTAEDFTFA